jgi:uncharacterized OB-fold protein
MFNQNMVCFSQDHSNNSIQGHLMGSSAKAAIVGVAESDLGRTPDKTVLQLQLQAARGAFGPFAEETPFVVAIVELEEGVRMMTRIVDAPRERIVIGADVKVTFETLGENITLPYFRLAA